MRGVFATAATGIFSTFAMMSLFAALLPSFLAETFDQPSHLVTGGGLLLVFGSAALAPLIIGRGSIRRGGLYGMIAVTGGLVLFIIGLAETWIAPLMIGCALAGFGGGCLFVSTLALINRDAPPDRRAEAVSAYFVAGYIGVTLPPIAVGIGSVHIGILPSVLGICALIIALAIVTEIGIRRFGSA
jgi:MFS family permease